MPNIYKKRIAWNKGKKASSITIQRMSAAHKGQPSYWKGKSMSEKTKEKLRRANKDQIPWNKGLKTGPLSKEHIKKLSIVRKGRKVWNKWKKCPQISASRKGQRLSKEHKKRLAWRVKEN